MKLEFITGLELELEYNKDVLGHIDCGRYHSDVEDGAYEFGSHFWAEEDGSLGTRGSFGSASTDVAELVSVPFKHTEWENVFNSFKKTVYRRVSAREGISLSDAERKYSLKDLVCFNETTGCHIHIGFLKTDPRITWREDVEFKGHNFDFKGRSINLRRIITPKLLHKIRKLVCSRVKEKLPDIYDRWIERYFRRYAKIVGNVIDFHDRYREFNFSLDDHIEYRSFHLNGVKTWEQMKTMLSIVFSTIDELFNKEITRKKPFKKQKKEVIKTTITTEFSNERLVDAEDIRVNEDVVLTKDTIIKEDTSVLRPRNRSGEYTPNEMGLGHIFYAPSDEEDESSNNDDDNY